MSEESNAALAAEAGSLEFEKMLLSTINLEICHPEQSRTASEATGRAQSKDPCPRPDLVRRIEAFSRRPDFRELEENSLRQQNCAKSKEILRLRERLRARCAQDGK